MMDTMATPHQELVGRNVRRFREERGLSQGALARRAGLAKQTLSTIEQGRGNPTVETLSLLGEALDVSVRRLLTEWGTPVYVQRRDEGEWHDQGHWTERLLGEIYGSGYVRSLLLRLEKGQHEDRPITPYAPGALHHLYVVSGRLRVGPAGDPVDVGPGDFVRYPSDVPHRMVVLTERATALVVATLPQVRQIGTSR